MSSGLEWVIPPPCPMGGWGAVPSAWGTEELAESSCRQWYPGLPAGKHVLRTAVLSLHTAAQAHGSAPLWDHSSRASLLAEHGHQPCGHQLVSLELPAPGSSQRADSPPLMAACASDAPAEWSNKAFCFQGLVHEWELPGDPGFCHHYPAPGPHEAAG